MKRKWHHPEEDPNAKTLVRSIAELQDASAFRERHELEFPKAVEEMRDESDQELSRRGFVKLMGASTALAGLGLAACRRPVGHIVPFTKSVEWIVPGEPLLYTTAMPRLGGCTPMIATTHEGRPTHLQGNPLHPGNPGGGVDSFANSSILDLYDPERSGDYKLKGKPVPKASFDSALAESKKQLTAAGGNGLAILHGESTSPTRARVLAELIAKLPGAKAYSYEALSHENLDQATEGAFGGGARQVYDFSKAKRILSLGCDFLGLDRLGEAGVAQFAEGRKVDGDGSAKEKMNRLYVVEHAFTLTGGMADHRLPVAASQILAAAAQVAKALGAETGGIDGAAALDAAWVEAMVADLKLGGGLVVAGPRQPAAVHALAIAMNQTLKAFGESVNVVQAEPNKSGSIRDLASAIEAGEVKTLVVTTQADPVYDAPADLKFGELLAGVETVIHLSPRNLCATARAATWQVPGTHFLEEWGDLRSSDGTYSIVQPMILPLYAGVSELNFLLSLIAEDKEATDATPQSSDSDAALEAVKASFAVIAKEAGVKDVDQAWNHTLRDGFLPGSAYKPSGTASSGGISKITDGVKPAAAPTDGSFEVVFTADSKVWDGRYINNGWQQECPDPISKIVWDNAALLSIATLKKLGVSEKDLVIEDKTRLIKVSLNGAEAYYPIVPSPGHADNSISISMGYGQKDAGKVAGSNDGAGTGFDCFPLRTSQTPFIATGAKVELVNEKVAPREGLKKSKYYTIALTQEHNSMEGRALFRDANAEQFDEDPGFAHKRGMEAHAPANKPIYKGQDFDYERDHQWGMTIDLNACIGCNACTSPARLRTTSRSSARSRSHGPRDALDPDGSLLRSAHLCRPRDARAHQPRPRPGEPGDAHAAGGLRAVRGAPCETVCPVNATVHTEEGLNTMAYNRCIGTRYCANNCPYKARRFNYFDYNKRNPLDTTSTRGRSDRTRPACARATTCSGTRTSPCACAGSMEKCTYCVQRLKEAKIRQKEVRAAANGDNLRIPTDSVKTACQDACPADAIGFGNLGNKDECGRQIESLAAQLRPAQLHRIRPRTSYLARVKNPNTDMPDAKFIAQSTTPTAAH